jgi:DNA-binding XRE family transcriptional regulator
VYVDSNIVLSKYIQNDTFRNLNEQIFDQSDLVFVTGFISLVETQSILGRLWRNQAVKFDEALIQELSQFPVNLQIERITEYCFKQLPIQIYHSQSTENVSFQEKQFEVDGNLSLAFRLGRVFSLRTLDLFQIASAFNIKLYQRVSIQYFLTNDDLILQHSNVIRRTVGFTPISSQDLLQLLNPVRIKKKKSTS